MQPFGDYLQYKTFAMHTQTENIPQNNLILQNPLHGESLDLQSFFDCLNLNGEYAKSSIMTFISDAEDANEFLSTDIALVEEADYAKLRETQCFIYKMKKMFKGIKVLTESNHKSL